MKTLYLATLTVIATALGGCSDTADGVQSDTERNAESVSKSANDSMAGSKDSAASASAAMGLTPRLKTAITSDAQLNDARNRINIDSNDTTVTIDGTVYSEEMKSKAESIVMATMAEAKATQKVVNNLVVGTK